jgi:stalled ribosome rescue protein Dom34
MEVVLLDHHSARFFGAKNERGSFIELERLEPHDPHGFRRHLEHRKEADYQGQRIPEAGEFFERIAQRLENAPSILLIGDATAKSSAMRAFLDYLQEKHNDVAARVMATVHADLSAITLGEIDQIARRYA